MKKTYKIAVIFTAMLTLVSCFDGFDQADPNYIPNEVNSVNDCEPLVTATYNALYNQTLWSFSEGENSADMAFPGGSYRMGEPRDQTLATYYKKTYTNTSKAVASRYAALYTGVYRSNQAIEALESLIEKGITTEEDTDWLKLMAQARTLRGMFHFFIHSLYNFGDVVMLDYVPSSIAELAPALSKSEDVMAFFRADFQWAIDNWPTGAMEEGEITKVAAQTLLGTSYLYNQEWELCSKVLLDVINNKSYSLVRDEAMQRVFGVLAEFNTESIFEVNYKEGVHPELGSAVQNTVNTLYTTSKSKFSYPAWLVLAYQNEKINTKDPRNMVVDRDGIYQYYTRPSITEEHYPINTDKPIADEALGFVPSSLDPATLRYRTISLRASASSVLAVDTDFPYYLGQDYTADFFSIGDKSGIGYSRKYINWDIYEKETDQIYNKGNSGRNVQVLRLAGVYLMYAEAQNELGNTAVALTYLNKIRERWGLELLGSEGGDNNGYSAAAYDYDGVLYDQATLRAHIQDNERPLELAQEGFSTRFIDLRRWGNAKERYQKLGAKRYGLVKVGLDGSGENPKTGYADIVNSSRVVDLDSDEAFKYISHNDVNVEFVDFVDAAQNYTDKLSYWPIPLGEIQSNPNLEKNGVKIHY